MTEQMRYGFSTKLYRFIPIIWITRIQYKDGTALVLVSITDQYGLSGTGYHLYT